METQITCNFSIFYDSISLREPLAKQTSRTATLLNIYGTLLTAACCSFFTSLRKHDAKNETTFSQSQSQQQLSEQQSQDIN